MAKPYLQLTAHQKRQAVLDLLNTRGGMVFADIKTALGANQSLSSVLNAMSARGEIAKGRRITGNQTEWVAKVKTTATIRMGPLPANLQPAVANNRRTPGARIIRLLDKPNTSRGGQCALDAHHGIQSGMQLTMESA